MRREQLVCAGWRDQCRVHHVGEARERKTGARLEPAAKLLSASRITTICGQRVNETVGDVDKDQRKFSAPPFGACGEGGDRRGSEVVATLEVRKRSGDRFSTIRL